MNTFDNHRIAYFCHGVAGLKGIHVLENALKHIAQQVYVVTYNNDNNSELIDFLKVKGISHSFYSGDYIMIKNEIREFKPDLILSIHFRHKVPVEILHSAKKGGINLHPSLLPKYRGAFSVPWVIVNQEKKTGITFHYMNEKFDDGNILIQREKILKGEETAYTLFHDLIDLGVESLKEALKLIFIDGFKGHIQQGTPSYFPRKLPFSGKIDTEWNIQKVEAFIRAMHFPPHEGAKLEASNGMVEIRNIEEYNKIRGEEC